jgi:hydrogenase maturation protease
LGRAVTTFDELAALIEVEAQDPPPRVLVAGIGNIFLGDDGFGVEVARQLLHRPETPGVKVADFGIRGVHLAYELLYGYEVLVLVDTVAGDDPAGTLSLIDVPANGDGAGAEAMDAHRMDPAAVLAMMRDLGGRVGRVMVVGCQAAATEEGIGLSEAVAAAVPGAVGIVLEVIASAVDAPKREAS